MPIQSCGELWALPLYPGVFGTFASILGQKCDKILKFVKVARSDVFELPDHPRLLRIDFSILKVDSGAQKVHLLRFSQN